MHGRDDPFDKEGSDDDFMTSHKSKHTLSFKKPVKKSTETGQLDVLEGRFSVVEDVIKDWRRHEDNKEELRRELADCKDSIKAMECELSAKRRKLAIQENMRCLICKTIHLVIVLYFHAASNLERVIHVFMNGYLKALPVHIVGHKWILIVASNFLMLFN